MRAPRVVVVGLGPAGADLLLPAARAALSRVPVRFVRTARHPAAEELTRHGLAFDAFDETYDSATDLDTAYRAITEALLTAAADHGTVCYAVPGSPAVAERSVVLLREAARRGEVELEVVPGLSFADLAWSRLGVDPMEGGHVVDARTFTVSAAGVAGSLLIAQCDDPHLLSDTKLALLESLGPDAEVVVLQRLGLLTEHVRTVRLVDLDRVVEPDHLTSLYVDTGDRAIASEFASLVALSERLRGPRGCPWDAEQDHHSLARYLLEEAYETVETIEALPAGAPAVDVPAGAYAALEDELGDLLYQVLFHALLAREAGAFTIADVCRGIHDKLVRRHPHVFGDAEAETSSAVMATWEQIKKSEKGTQSLVDGISPGLPSLLYAHKLYRKAASIGLPTGSREDALRRVRDATDALALGTGDPEPELGELLAGAVVLARELRIDGESALRGWAARYRDRFARMEALAIDRGIELHAAAPEVVADLWAGAAP